MATRRTSIPKRIRKRLVNEAGGKCANPGCASRRTEAHHIREWHIYGTHDAQHMVALCAACHDAAHHGQLDVSDDTLYRWKGIKRDPSVAHHSIWVEPAGYPELWFGSLAVCVKQEAAVISLSDTNRVQLAVKGSEILIIDSVVTSVGGQDLVRVRNNTVTHRRVEDVQFRSVPGRVELVAPIGTPLVPRWLVNRMNAPGKDGRVNRYPRGDHVTLFGAEVIRPGVARIEGIWALDDRAIIADGALHFISRTHPRPITIVAKFEGESKFVIDGEIDRKLFGFAGDGAMYSVPYDPANGPLPIDPAEV